MVSETQILKTKVALIVQKVDILIDLYNIHLEHGDILERTLDMQPIKTLKEEFNDNRI